MILDTSVVLDFIWEREPVSTELTKLLVESNEEAFLTPLQFAEVADVSAKNKCYPEDSFKEIEIFSTLISLTRDDLIESGKLKWEMRQGGRSKFSLADAMMLAVGRRIGHTVVTKDRDFIGIDGAFVLGVPSSQC